MSHEDLAWLRWAVWLEHIKSCADCMGAASLFDGGCAKGRSLYLRWRNLPEGVAA